MMKHVSFFVLFLWLVSCGQENVHKEISRDFPRNRWANSNIKSFDFTIEDSNQPYDLNILFSHIKDSQYDLIPLHLEVIGSDNFLLSENLLVRVKDSTGSDSGDCIGDYCDVETGAVKNQLFQKGKYTVRIQNKFPGSYLPNVIAVGIRVSKSLPE